MESEESDRKQKQQFLFSEIIDGGYDAAVFQEFLDKKKPNGGTNVDLWTFQELSSLIKEFKTQQDPHKIEAPEGIEEKNDSEKVIDEKNEEGKSGEVSKEKDLYEDDNYHKTINCRELPLAQIFKEKSNPQISVPEFVIVPGGIFSSGYVNFKIVTTPLDWEVKRRFSDFLWLRTHLLKLYPGVFIPPIPVKKVTRSFDQVYLTKRKAFLQKFLQDCLRNPLIKNTSAFIDFISIKDDLAFQVKKKDATNKKGPERLDQHQTLTGKVNISINEEIKNYTQFVSEYIGDADTLYTKKLNNQLLLDFDQLSNTLFSMGEVFENLFRRSNHFNNHVNQNKNPKLDDIYVTLNNMMVNWGNTLGHQMEIIQDYLCNFFKYEKHYNFCLKETIKERNNVCNDGRSMRKADAQRDKKFDVSKLSAIFQKGDANLQALKDNFAYYNQQTYLEIPRCLEEKCEKYIKQFIEFGKVQTDIVTEMHVNWADVISHFEDIYGNIKGGGQLILKKGESGKKGKKADDLARISDG